MSLGFRNDIERQRLSLNQQAIATQVAVQQAKVQEAQALLGLKQKQADALSVRAGIDGVLVQTCRTRWANTWPSARRWRRSCSPTS